MATPLTAIDICNLALSKLGAGFIASFTDPAQPAIAQVCSTNFTLAFLEIAREAPWNFLKRTVVLQATTNPTNPATTTVLTPTPIPWAPNTSYLANVNLTFGGSTYATAYAYTSTFSFVNDLTTGALLQIDVPEAYPFNIAGGQYISGWPYAWLLPSDFVRVIELNETDIWSDEFGGNQPGSLFEIMQGATVSGGSSATLFTVDQTATIKYVANISDTSQYDPLFVNALSFLLASKMATQLRKDDGNFEMSMLAGYEKALTKARVKNGGERKPMRYNAVNSSRFVAARFNSTNG